MAHQIETHAGQAAAVFAHTDPWHRLGTVVRDRAFTAEEAMRLGHLGGWDVRKAPLSTTEITADGVTTLPVPGQHATVRTNPFTGQREALGVVGDAYTPLQNEAHAAFLNTLADESGAVFETAGSLRGGRQVFITMRLPDTLRIGGADDVEAHLAALNSHDGSSAFRILLTPIRVVCANTQAAALANHRASIAIRHTRKASGAVQAAREALGLTFAYTHAFQTEADRMIQTTLTDAAFDALITDVFGAPAAPDAPARTRTADTRRRTHLRDLYHHAPTQAPVRGTAWAAYQAITEYIDHHAPVRTRGDKAHARATRLLTSEAPTRLKERAWALTAAY